MSHALLIAFLVVGGPLSIRWPRLARLHLWTAAAVSAVFVLGAPCPLTIVEDAAREAAGWSYGGGVGFVTRYLLRPLGLSQGRATTATILVLWTAPTVIGHAVVRHRRRRIRPAVTEARAA